MTIFVHLFSRSVSSSLFSISFPLSYSITSVYNPAQLNVISFKANCYLEVSCWKRKIIRVRHMSKKMALTLKSSKVLLRRRPAPGCALFGAALDGINLLFCNCVKISGTPEIFSQFYNNKFSPSKPAP